MVIRHFLFLGGGEWRARSFVPDGYYIYVQKYTAHTGNEIFFSSTKHFLAQNIDTCKVNHESEQLAV
jgi:hypothetical protein